VTKPLVYTLLCAILLLGCPIANAQAQPDHGASKAAQASDRPADNIAPLGETDSADIPEILRGKIDEETYLRLRNEHIRLLRGLLDKGRDPKERANAIRNLQQQERQLRQRFLSQASPRVRSAAGASGSLADVPANLLPQSLLPWTPLGPAPLPNGQTTAVSMAVSGRVTTIAVHPTNENIVYVGTAQGGVYRSLNGGTTWTALFDDALTLSIGSLAIDPLDPTTLFVGTGEGNLSADSFFGVGLYIIKHADTTPELNGPFNLDGGSNDVFTGRSITKVLVSSTDDNIVFVATTSGIGGIGADSIPSVLSSNLPSRGLYRSTNALSANPTFTKITVQPANGGNRGITDIVFDPANPNVLIAGVNGFSTGGNDGGLWRTTNALDPVPTFTNQQVVGTATATIQIKLASNAVGGVTTVLAATGEAPATTPAAPGNGSNCGAPGWVRRSNDAGQTFSLGLIQTSGFCNTQCFYDMAPAMDPTNSNIIYLGGSANADTNPPRATCRSNVMTRTLDGLNFSRIDTGLHADTHVVVVAPSNPNVVYAGNDGGVWRSSNQGTTWVSLNNNGFNATQFQSVAVHPTDRNFSIGGTQDNGTPFLQPDATWTRADFGDGGFALIDQSSVDTTNVTMYHTYSNSTNSLIGFGRVTLTANAHDNGWGFLGCNGTVANNGFRCADTVLFYAPMALGPGSPNTFYFGTDRLYRSVNRGSTMTLVSQGPFQSGQAVSAIGVSPQNDNVRIVGLRNGGVFATATGATPLANVRSATMPAKYVSRAVIDPNDVNTAYVVFSGYGIQGSTIWKTTNLNANPPTWTAMSSGLPDVPFNAFVVDPGDSQKLYAGSDIGVYWSTDGGASWNPYGTGLPRVAVFDMAIQNPNRVLRIATHGRGMWEIPLGKLDQTITFAALADKTFGDAPFNVSATASSGLTVTFSASGNCTVDVNQVTLTGAGSCSITASQAGNDAYNAAPDVTRDFTIGKYVTTTTVASSVNPVQYSDLIDVTATVTPDAFGGLTPATSADIYLNGVKIGTVTLTASGGKLTGTLSSYQVLLAPPGPYQLKAVFKGVDTTNFTVADATTSLSVSKEDARATYTGALFASTANATSTSAIVTLAATIQDITAVDSNSDPDAGDIRNATVKFVDRDTNQTLCTPLGIGLVTTGDTKTGTVTCNFNATLANNSPSRMYTVGVVVDGYYTRNDSIDDTVVTVAQPLPNLFITGGGYLLLSSSAGLHQGDPGSKANFGLSVKYNAGGRNLQGSVNLIVRSAGRVYQIKGNAMTSLAVQSTTPPAPATFNGKASILDITSPNHPVSVDGNASLQIDMIDNGNLGNPDTIGITLWDKNGGLWFSSSWNGVKTIQQPISAGNLSVR